MATHAWLLSFMELKRGKEKAFNEHAMQQADDDAMSDAFPLVRSCAVAYAARFHRNNGGPPLLGLFSCFYFHRSGVICFHLLQKGGRKGRTALFRTRDLQLRCKLFWCWANRDHYIMGSRWLKIYVYGLCIYNFWSLRWHHIGTVQVNISFKKIENDYLSLLASYIKLKHVASGVLSKIINK